MYRVYIADDEFLVVRGLMNRIGWKALDCEVVGSARDGLEAREGILALKPDIVITDIRMPGLSGLELIREVSPKTDAAFIIFSGYGEFEYAKEALRLETVDYLLKPINIDEIEKAVRRAQFRCIQRSYLSLSSQENDRAVEQRLIALIDEDGSKEVSERLPFAAFAPLIMRSARPDAPPLAGDPAFVARIKALESDNRKLFLMHSRQNLVVVACALRHNEIYELRKQLIHLVKQVQRERGFSFYWGVGDACGDQRKLAAACAGAIEMLSYALFTREQNDAMPSLAWPRQADYDQMIRGIAQTLISPDDPGALEEGVSQFFERMLYEKFSIEAIRELSISLAYYCRFYCERELERPIPAELLANIAPAQIMALGTAEENRVYLTRALAEIRAALTSPAIPGRGLLIPRLKAFVDENLAKPITLNDLSEFAGLNPSYVSHLFKRETGENLFEYITDCRIKKARKLIRSTSMLIYEVARQVGYEDHRYFCQVFKKKTGVTALEYRDGMGGEK